MALNTPYSTTVLVQNCEDTYLSKFNFYLFFARSSNLADVCIFHSGVKY